MSIMDVAIHDGSPGLANRIKNYAGIYRTFRQALTVNEADAYIFDDLRLATQKELDTYPTFDHWRFPILPGENRKTGEYKYIDLLYEDTPKYFIDVYREAFSRLHINSDIVDYCVGFTSDWDKVVGLHIRSWYCDRMKYHNNELFESVIDTFDKDRKIFLCGDNSDVLKHFEDKYGDRIITHPQKKYNHPHMAESGHNKSVQDTVDAFIDLYLLSMCDTIVGTYASTFAEVAWWLGGNNPKVVIPEPYNLEESFRNRIFEKL